MAEFRFVTLIFSSLLCFCFRSAGGLRKAGGAESSSVMRHCDESLLPDLPRRAAHAQAEASDHTQRPQG